MLYDNFAMLTKRELLIRIVKLLKKDELITGLKYLPVEMRPRNKRPVRCASTKTVTSSNTRLSRFWALKLQTKRST